MSAGASFGAAQGLGALNINGGALYHLGTSMAGNLANAATRSVLTKSNFGDNIIASIPDTIAQTIGGVIGDGVRKAAEEKELRNYARSLDEDEKNQVGIYAPSVNSDEDNLSGSGTPLGPNDNFGKLELIEIPKTGIDVVDEFVDDTYLIPRNQRIDELLELLDNGEYEKAVSLYFNGDCIFCKRTKRR